MWLTREDGVFHQSECRSLCQNPAHTPGFPSEQVRPRIRYCQPRENNQAA
jgi:hypothetical protein